MFLCIVGYNIRLRVSGYSQLAIYPATPDVNMYKQGGLVCLLTVYFVKRHIYIGLCSYLSNFLLQLELCNPSSSCLHCEYHLNGKHISQWITSSQCSVCKGNLTTEHNAQILARGIQSILDKYSTAEGCIPCKGDTKRKLWGTPKKRVTREPRNQQQIMKGR